MVGRGTLELVFDSLNSNLMLETHQSIYRTPDLSDTAKNAIRIHKFQIQYFWMHKPVGLLSNQVSDFPFLKRIHQLLN